MRFVDPQNYVYVTMDRSAGRSVLGSVVGGVATEQASWAWPGGVTYKSSQWFNVTVDVADTIAVRVSGTLSRHAVYAVCAVRECDASCLQIDGVLRLQSATVGVKRGVVGFLSSGVGAFDDVTLLAACDGSQCLGMVFVRVYVVVVAWVLCVGCVLVLVLLLCCVVLC